MSSKRRQSNKDRTTASGLNVDVDQLNQTVNLEVTHDDGQEWPPLTSKLNTRARAPTNAWGQQNLTPAEKQKIRKIEFKDLVGRKEHKKHDDVLLSDGHDSDYGCDHVYADLFSTLKKLTDEQINEPTMEWNCPVCPKGSGAIVYKSLQALIAHAKITGSDHRKFSLVLEEELGRRGITIKPSKESYHKWKGLNRVFTDKLIVWPPMVIIMNTQLEQNEKHQWTGMSNEELLTYFWSYGPTNAHYASGQKGHMGRSVLIFEPSAVGFTQAELLSQHLEEQGTGRQDALKNYSNLVLPGCPRQLYGYMALESDMDDFNQLCRGGRKLEFEMVSYLEKLKFEKMHKKELEKKVQKFKDESRIVQKDEEIYEVEKYIQQLQESIKNQVKITPPEVKLMDEQSSEFDQKVDELMKEFDKSMTEMKQNHLRKLSEMEQIRDIRLIWLMKALYVSEERAIREKLDICLVQLMNEYPPPD